MVNTLCCGNIDCGFESHQFMLIYLQVHGFKGFVAMLATKTYQPQVNLRNPLHAGDKACKQGSTLILNPGQMSR